MLYRNILFTLSFLLILPGCYRHRVIKHWVNIKEQSCDQPQVTSGTRRCQRPRNQAVQPEVIPHITVWIHGTIFPWQVKTVPHGLTHVDNLHEQSRYRTCARILGERYPHSYQYDQFYAFGWSGQLSFIEREGAAS